MEIKNAIIKKVIITNGDHGLLSAYLTLDYGGMGQSFGGYNLYNANGDCAGKFIDSCLKVADVDEWNSLVGKTIRVKSNHTGIQAIGNIIKDEWFTPSEDLL